MQQVAWKIVQFSVFSAVLFSNVHYQWTPNGYAAGVVALLVTLLVSAIPVMVEDFAQFLRRMGGRFAATRRGLGGRETRLSQRQHHDS